MIALAGLVIFGVLAQWLASKLKLPAILPLILIGLAVGPFSTFFTEDGSKFIEPIWTGQNGLFPGANMFYFVSLAVGIILFEGGLTLRRVEVMNVSKVVINLITFAALISLVGSGLAAHFIFDLSWGISLLFASLVIVTGPTVIRPVLRYIPTKKDVSAVLRWEGILLDPIGAVAAVLIFHFIRDTFLHSGGNLTLNTFLGLGETLLIGFALGFTAAHFLAFCIKKNLVPQFLINIFTLAMVLSTFVIANYLAEESGLVAAVVMGMVLANVEVPNYKEISEFKESLSILLVSILFILLAANINIEDLRLVMNNKAVWLFLIIVFAIRPLGVFLSSIGSPLRFKERLFISWVGPRGIVAAGVSSLFGMELERIGVPGAEYITPLVFMIVLGTVIINATTARMVAKILGVFLDKSEGVLIVGASPVSRLIAAYLKENERHVVLIDTNGNNINRAKDMGLEAFQTSIYSDELDHNIQVGDIGYLMALTENAEINKAAIARFQKKFGENGTFRLVAPEETDDPENNPKEGLFSYTDDYFKLSKTARKYPNINELKVKSQEHFEGLIELSKTLPEVIPLFVKDPEGELRIIPSDSKDIKIEGERYKFVYLGRPSSDIRNEVFNINYDELHGQFNEHSKN